MSVQIIILRPLFHTFFVSHLESTSPSIFIINPLPLSLCFSFQFISTAWIIRLVRLHRPPNKWGVNIPFGRQVAAVLVVLEKRGNRQMKLKKSSEMGDKNHSIGNSPQFPTSVLNGDCKSKLPSTGADLSDLFRCYYGLFLVFQRSDCDLSNIWCVTTSLHQLFHRGIVPSTPLIFLKIDINQVHTRPKSRFTHRHSTVFTLANHLKLFSVFLCVNRCNEMKQNVVLPVSVHSFEKKCAHILFDQE